ncbi:MAG: hypothetical protein AABW92_03980, partial [Nanoarchaeota archaeon]
MSKFTKDLLEEIKKITGRAVVLASERNISRFGPSLPLDLTPELPSSITEVALKNLIASYHEENGIMNAKKTLSIFPPEQILIADNLLDNLDLIGTPPSGIERLTGMMKLIDYNYALHGTTKLDRSLIGIMSDYWNKIPIFYEDLTVVFDTMKEMYSSHPRLKSFADWTANYDFRDGILDITNELL